jgi:hypothetical protein
MNKELMMKAAIRYKGVWPNENETHLREQFELFVESLFDGAPEGTTHFRPNALSSWYKISNAENKHYLGKKYGWVSSESIEKSLVSINDLIPRPSKKTEPEAPYMPKVGEECEVYHGDDWIKCLYLGIDIYGNHAYQISKGDYKGEFNADPSIENFRPLKTEREKFIIEGIDDLKEINPFESQGGLLGMLFDKGYRKND